jgi:L-asparagine transporter-like permease
LFSLDGDTVTAFRITIVVLGLLGSTWIIWDLGWRGVYIVGMIIAAVFVERWATHTDWNPVLAVAAFVLVATLLGFRLFGRATMTKR